MGWITVAYAALLPGLISFVPAFTLQISHSTFLWSRTSCDLQGNLDIPLHTGTGAQELQERGLTLPHPACSSWFSLQVLFQPAWCHNFYVLHASKSSSMWTTPSSVTSLRYNWLHRFITATKSLLSQLSWTVAAAASKPLGTFLADPGENTFLDSNPPPPFHLKGTLISKESLIHELLAYTLKSLMGNVLPLSHFPIVQMWSSLFLLNNNLFFKKKISPHCLFKLLLQIVCFLQFPLYFSLSFHYKSV